MKEILVEMIETLNPKSLSQAVMRKKDLFEWIKKSVAYPVNLKQKREWNLRTIRVGLDSQKIGLGRSLKNNGVKNPGQIPSRRKGSKIN